MAGIWIHFLDHCQPQFRQIVGEALTQAGLDCHPTIDPAVPTGPGMVFFDTITKSLFDFLHEVSRNGIERVLAVSISSSALPGGTAWELLQAGASDAFTWNQMANPAGRVAAQFERWEQVDQIVHSPLVRNNLVGVSPAWTSTLRQVVEVASFTDAPVLITGETGTGKELVARLIHTLDRREAKRDLVILDCTTVVPDLSGSEFFGHERGAFTGAVSPRDGAFALADEGTLFLDEVGDLPLALQAQLLRVVQEGTYKRIGGNSWQRTRFRLVCATNQDLLQQVKQGRMRQDFYYRIAGWNCALPPLRERLEDIVPLVRHFMCQLRPDEEPPELDDSVKNYLLRRNYPGNVRDMRQLVSRVMYRHVGPHPISAGDIPEEERPFADVALLDWRGPSFENAIRRGLTHGAGLREIGQAAKEVAIRIAIENEQGSLQRAAKRLGVTDRALQLHQASRLPGARIG